MKKLFYLVALAAAVTFAACGTKSENKEADNAQATVQEEGQDALEQAMLDEIINGLTEELRDMDEEGMQFGGVEIEGKNIVMKLIVDESQFGGMTLKQAFEMVGMNEEAFAQMMKQEMLKDNDLDEETRVGLALLRKYEYNIDVRLLGSQSNDVMDCMISYQDLPK